MGSVADNFLRVLVNRNEIDVAIDDIGYTLFVSYYCLALAVGRLFLLKGQLRLSRLISLDLLASERTGLF